MKVIYMGTADFAREPLEKIAQKHEVVAVVSQPDKPNSKRGLSVVFSPVKNYAVDNGITVYQPLNISSEESIDFLSSLGADIIIVCAYGQVVKKNVLELTKYGCYNIHASILPKYRGAAPIHRAIIDGNKKSGVSIMKMAEGLDTGDVLLIKETEIGENMNIGELHDTLKSIGAEAILEAMEQIENQTAVYTKQDEESSTYAQKIYKEECFIDFNFDAQIVHNKIRGLNPFPTAKTRFGGKMIKLYDCYKTTIAHNKKSGTILDVNKDGIIIACKSDAVVVKRLQPEGKKQMDAVAFFRGLRGEGEVLFGE